MSEPKIPVEQVLNDMYNEDGIVASAARDFYYINYATKEQQELMDEEENI